MFLKICSVSIVSFLLVGCSSINSNTKVMNTFDGTGQKITRHKNVKKIPPLEMDKLKLTVKEVKKLHSDTSFDSAAGNAGLYKTVFGKVIMRNNNQILGFLDEDNGNVLFTTGAQIGGGNLKEIIQPIKDKNFFIIITDDDGDTSVFFYDMDTGVHKKLPGDFLAIKDINGDGLPEIFTYTGGEYSDKRTIYLYKIINPQTNSSLALMTKNILPVQKGKGIPTPSYSSCDSVTFPKIKYISSDNIVYTDGVKSIEINCPDTDDPATYVKEHSKAERIYEHYFQKWDKGNLQIKSTVVDLSNYEFNPTFNTIETIKLTTAGWNNSGDCINFRLNNYKQRERENAKTEGWVYLPKLLICGGGKNYTKLPNGLLAIFDANFGTIHMFRNGSYFYYTNDDSLIMHKIKIFNHDVELVSTYSKYLIVYNLKTNKSHLFLWKNILGYQPLMIKYFDGKNLVLIDKKNVIHIYKTAFSYSKVKKETW